MALVTMGAAHRERNREQRRRKRRNEQAHGVKARDGWKRKGTVQGPREHPLRVRITSGGGREEGGWGGYVGGAAGLLGTEANQEEGNGAAHF